MFLLERMKLVVEGAGAAPVAALLAGRVPGTGPAVALLSGGNIDATLLISVMRHGLTLAGRYLVVRTRLADRPGELIKLLSLVASEHGNVVSVEHHREGMDMPVTESEVELTLVMRDQEHCAALIAAMRQGVSRRAASELTPRRTLGRTWKGVAERGSWSRASRPRAQGRHGPLRRHRRLHVPRRGARPRGRRRIAAALPRAAAHELERHGGTVEKFIGDAVDGSVRRAAGA